MLSQSHGFRSHVWARERWSATKRGLTSVPGIRPVYRREGREYPILTSAYGHGKCRRWVKIIIAKLCGRIALFFSKNKTPIKVLRGAAKD